MFGVSRLFVIDFAFEFYIRKTEKMAYVIAIVRNQFLLPRALIIRKEWIYQLYEAKTLNNGINRNQTHTVFYSTNDEKNPDFSIQKRVVFDDNVEDADRTDALYAAKIYRFFGKYRNFI